MKALSEASRPALIADDDNRRRDERFATQERYKAVADPLHDKSTAAAEPDTPAVYDASDFRYDPGGALVRLPCGQAAGSQRAASRSP